LSHGSFHFRVVVFDIGKVYQPLKKGTGLFDLVSKASATISALSCWHPAFHNAASAL